MPSEELRALLAESEAAACARRARAWALALRARLGVGEDSPVVLFGAGRLGRRMARALRCVGAKAVAFADNGRARWGETVEGLPVLSPNEAVARFGATHPFVVSIWSPGHRFVETAAQLEALGCACVAPFQLLVWRYPDALLPHFFFDLPERILARRGELARSFGLLGDDRSRAEFVAQLRWRLRLDAAGLPEPAGAQAYWDRTILAPADGELFVDCGAFDGDTVTAFLHAHQNRFGGIVAYEPDAGTLRKLQATVEALAPDVRGRIVVRHAAVAAQQGVARFDADGAMHSSISETGTVEVPAVTLDAELAGRRPTFVKMDIEGAELAALRGAARVVREARPVLAICVDHRPEDLWAIPALITELVPDYVHAFRSHGTEGFDTIWYGVPPERRP
ncbi:MAG: FkbM family methyltransferase [Gemmatimonadota bacterium]|nr:FkbM family methyltransferase [Gemmatimonadota bacterium]